MVIIDGHLDLSWNALGWNRDLEWSVSEIRKSEQDMTGAGRARNTVAFPEMRQGKIGICFATLLARAKPEGNYPDLDFRSQEIACAVAKGQLSYYRNLEEKGVCRIITDLATLRGTFSGWENDPDNMPFGFIVSMEGADPVLSPKHVAGWYEAGLRIIGPAHYGRCIYAHGTASSGGLAPAGPDLLKAMDEVGMMLDMTHLADESFWEASKIFQGPVLASHNACRSLVPGDRQFSDDQLRFLLERDAVIGVPLDVWMLMPDWKKDRPSVALEHAVKQIDYICQLSGSTKHVAIGSDLDGGFGTEQSPADLDTIADLQKFGGLLKDRGYSEADVRAVFSGNWLRLFERAWSN